MAHAVGLEGHSTGYEEHDLASLLDAYTNLEVVGTGAGSTIFKGVSVDDGRLYAVKLVKWTKKGDERFLKQAANEFEVASHFDHENLVRMYDYRRLRRYLKTVECMVEMDYFPGRMLSPKNKFTVPDLIGVFIQVARALNYMHQLGYVHTDIKPENILVDDLARAMVVDFGVACRRSSQKDRVQGTPEFIAPEQLSKKPLDERTDVYNLGTTMYKIFTGKVAPENVRMAVPLGNGAAGEAMSLGKLGVRDHNADISERFAHVIEKSCRRSRSRRYQTMREVLNELVACLREIAPPDHKFLKEAV
jgi:serine/threonine-protein kinase